MAGEGWTEMNRITWAEYNASRKQLQETVNINAGLFALKRVIDALHRRQVGERASVCCPSVLCAHAYRQTVSLCFCVLRAALANRHQVDQEALGPDGVRPIGTYPVAIPYRGDSTTHANPP